MFAALAKELGLFHAPSLRVRLTLWTAAISLVIQLLAGMVTFLYQARTMHQLADVRLRNRTRLVRQEISQLPRRLTEEDIRRIAAGSSFWVKGERVALAAYSPDGTLLASSFQPPLLLTDPRLPPLSNDGISASRRIVLQRLADDTERDNHFRVMLSRSPDDLGGVVLLVMTNDEYYESQLDLTRQFLLLLLSVGVLATAGAAWLISGVAVAPLRELHRVATAFTPESIRQEVALPAPATELESFRSELQAARERLRQAFNAQDRFISTVSHEIKTPIAVLLVEAETLSADQLPPEAKEFAESVRQEMRRLGSTIEMLLQLTRLSGGKSRANRARCVVNDFVLDAVVACVAVANEAKVSVDVRLHESDIPLAITGDFDLLRTMMDQLIRSAIRQSPPGKTVEVLVDAIEGGARITVRDRGAVIPASDMERLFDRYGESTKSNCEGSRKSLGLSLSQGIAELHGGVLRAVNLDGEGCDFIAELPLSPSGPSSGDPSTTSSDATRGADHAKSRSHSPSGPSSHGSGNHQ